jgi:hypothetical protein
MLDGKLVLRGYNQPYCAGGVKHPIAKFLLIAAPMAGVLFGRPSFVFQSFLLLIVVLHPPLGTKTRGRVVLSLAFLGSFAVLLASPVVVPYGRLTLFTEVPGVLTIDWLLTAGALVMMAAAIVSVRLITTRDYICLLELALPARVRPYALAAALAFGYGASRIPNLLRSASIAIRSRGGERLRLRDLLSDRGMDSIGLWSLFIWRDIDRMAESLEFTMRNRIRPEQRRSVMMRDFSLPDCAAMISLSLAILTHCIAHGK